jgi:hypothetical protein
MGRPPILIAISLCALGVAPVLCAETGGGAAVGVRQQRVAAMMQEVDQKFLALARTLEKTEPERAERLLKAFEESRTALIEPRMRQIATLLESSQLDNAGREEAKILEDVRRLITILMKEADGQETQEEIEQLKKWHQEISALLKDQQQQKAESGRLDRKEETLDTLSRQIAAVEELLRVQQDLVAETTQRSAEGTSALAELAAKQERLRRDTEFVNAEISRTRQVEESGGSDSRSPPPSTSTPGPGQKPLAAAVRHQKSAEQNLSAGQPISARSSGDQAKRELELALEELRKEAEKLKSPSEEALNRLAESQQALADRTESVSGDMSKAASGGKPGEAARSAGSRSLAQASQSMESASNSLKKKSPGDANSQQQQAEKQLSQARSEVEKRLAELGEKPEDPEVQKLETIFTEMLTRQQAATAQTVQFHKEHPPSSGELRRSERITIRRLSQEETDLAALAETAVRLIEAEGSTISFPAVVAELEESLRQIASFLEKQNSGSETQARQKDVEQTLKELLEALEMARQNGNSPGGSPQGGSGESKPALLPNTAELKLLRQMQLRINRHTAEFDRSRPQGDLPAEREAEVRRIAGLQRDVATMVRQVIERQKESSSDGLEFPGSDLLKILKETANPSSGAARSGTPN